MEQPDLGLLVGVEMEAEHLDNHAGEGVEEGQDLGDGEPAAGLLAGGLAEGRLQRRGVGGDGAGAVDEECAQAVPQAQGGMAARITRTLCGLGGGLAHGGRSVTQQRLQRRQRQAHARFAVRRGAEHLLGHVTQVSHGGVAGHHLKDEQVERADRPELALSPLVADFAAGGENLLIGQVLGEIALDAFEGL